MKKVFVLLLTLVLMVLFANTNNSTNELIVRNIYVQDNSYMDYYAEKYDLFNDEKKIVNIEEIVSFGDEIIDELSYSPDCLFFNLLVDKGNNNMILDYDLSYHGQIETNYFSLELLFEDEVYVISRFGYLTLSEIENSLVVQKCSSLVMQKLFGKDFMVYGEGASCGSTVGLALGGALVAAIISNSNNTSTTYQYISESSNNNGTISTEEKQNKNQRLLDKMIIAEAKDYLHYKEDVSGWTDEELKDAFKNACKVVIGGEMVALLDYLIKNPVIVLGVFVDEVGHRQYTKEALMNENSIVYSMEANKWTMLANSGKNMWFLNEFFLSFWISRDCKFLLVSNPNCFYEPGGIPHTYPIKNYEIGYYYSHELEYIYNCNYRWICDLPKDVLCNCKIMATREVAI